MILNQGTHGLYQVIPCSELTILRPELSSNLFLSHAFACWVLVCFLSPVIIF